MVIQQHPSADDLPAFALGALDAHEAQCVADHIAVCHVCRAEVRSYWTIVSLLLLGVPPCNPPPAIKRGLLQQVNAEHDAALVLDSD